MAEVCETCIMAGEIRHIQDEMKERKENEKETRKDVAEIRASQEKNIFVTEQIQKTQETQAASSDKFQTALTISNKEYQLETARLNKETQAENARLFKETSDKTDAYFKAADDRRLLEEKTALEDEKLAKVETTRLKEKQDDTDATLLAEKRSTRRAMWMTFYVLAAGTVFGVFVKYAPHIVGL